MNRTEQTYEFRPLRTDDGEYYRYENGIFIPDDGEYGLAFACPDTFRAFHIFMPYKKFLLWSWVLHGNWGAYIKGHPSGNAWHYMFYDDKDIFANQDWGSSRYNHPNIIAGDKSMFFVAQKKSGANGNGPKFHINDPYIVAGLVRDVETKEIIKFPDIFSCIYCGDLDWQKMESKK